MGKIVAGGGGLDEHRVEISIDFKKRGVAMAKTPIVLEELPLKQERINPLLYIRDLIEANKKVASVPCIA
ncbi:hypothetical protein ACFCP7_26510 [Paenibacillus elgii]